MSRVNKKYFLINEFGDNEQYWHQLPAPKPVIIPTQDPNQRLQYPSYQQDIWKTPSWAAAIFLVAMNIMSMGSGISRVEKGGAAY